MSIEHINSTNFEKTKKKQDKKKQYIKFTSQCETKSIQKELL